MTVEVVCGTNWGDEGKGRMVDYLARTADFVVRYQGGNNAGHTVINERGKFILHLVPSGVFYSHVTNVLGPGTVIDLEGLDRELTELQAGGIDCGQVLLSDRATIVFPFHRDEDAWEEQRLGANAYGSTRKGIAPAYGDRYLKKAIRVGDLLSPDALRRQLQHLIEWKKLSVRGLYQQEARLDVDELLQWTLAYGEKFKDRICDTTDVLESAASEGKCILLEAQLGALRDIYYGIYPYTTSSCTLAAFAPVGAGLFGRPIDRVIGVMKAFSTCIGEGPFVTAMSDDEARQLRETAGEYGATTGRPRRIGHFDAVASRFGTRTQGATEIALTKLDTLSGPKKLLICTHYEINGKRSDRFPLTHELERARPVYRDMDGWTEDLTGCRRFDDLPRTAQQYVLEIERLIETRIRWISVGPERSQLIDRGT